MESTEDNKQEIFSDWIKKLEKESWQMELLISGFSLAVTFNLQYAIDQFQDYINMNFNFSGLVAYALIVIWFAVKILSINLILHLILRAFWIGMIGLRSVSAEIDFENLQYGKFFTHKIRTQTRNLNEQIIALDNICSSIFAFTFLVVFWFISFTLHFAFIILILILDNWIGNIFPSSFIIEQLSNVVFYVILSTTFLYFTDFITLGLIKKINFISRLYYPFYYFYSFITFSFFYRSIYYHFLSRFKKKTIALIIFPYIIFAFVYHAYTIEYYIFIPDKRADKAVINNQYDNLREEEDYIRKASINSDIITEPFVKLFVRYDVEDNETIKKLCPEYQPHLEEGFNKTGNSRFHINNFLIIGRKKSENKPEDAIKCIASLYNIYINNSLLIDPEYFFYQYVNQNEKGILTYLSTKDLKNGKNEIIIKKKALIALDNENSSDSLLHSEISSNQILIDSLNNNRFLIEEEKFATIPFWVDK